MTTHLTARGRHHAEQTAKAMRSMISTCPHCKRRGNFRKFDYTGVGDLMWVCHYKDCGFGWTAESYRATPPRAQEAGE